MNVASGADDAAARIAGAIGEPARARMLYGLLDRRARTSTELAVVAGVSPSTASAHLRRLEAERLVKVLAQGKHRYYRLAGAEVARVLEGLSVLAGGSHPAFAPSTPHRLRAARTCYDHLAGALGVSLHERFQALGWLSASAPESHDAYELTPAGAKAFGFLGLDLEAIRAARRRFAFACLDWSERRSHLGGALGAAFLDLALRRRWVVQDPDGRAVGVTRTGERELRARFGLTQHAED